MALSQAAQAKSFVLQTLSNACSNAFIGREVKMGNIVPRAGIDPTSLAFLASVLPLHYVGSLMSPLFIPMPTNLCSSLLQRYVHATTLTPLEL